MGARWGVEEGVLWRTGCCERGDAVERVTVSLTRPADLVVDVDMSVGVSLTQGLLGRFDALSVTLVSQLQAVSGVQIVLTADLWTRLRSRHVSLCCETLILRLGRPNP